ncbi:unnamed protein product [Paramecium sonneborni]|uniref:Tetratricopeptide repeat protein n=1 Tax=Paramecium sonneborni TaxID=65129 RepID=A0A8S1NQ75_9CILI|nr:unnamed protein product [Paramecium sonneborni]
MNRFQEALEILEHAITKDTQNNQYYHLKAKILFKLNFVKESLSAFDEAIKRNQNDPYQYHNKGIQYQFMNQQLYIFCQIHMRNLQNMKILPYKEI